MSDKKNGSKTKKVVICVLLAVLVIVTALVISQLDNIKALYRGLTSSTDDLNTNIQQNNMDTADALTNAGINISTDDFDKINSGEMTAEEIAELISSSMSSGDANSSEKSEDDTEDIPPDTDGEKEVGDEPVSGDGVENSKQDVTDQPQIEDKPPQGETDKVTDNKNDESPKPPAKNDGKTEDNKTGSTDKPAVIPPKPQQDTGKPSVSENRPQQSGTVQQNKPTQQTKPQPGTQSSSSEKLSEEEYNKKVADLVAKMYVIKSDFLSQLSSFESRIKSEYAALPKEKKTTATKAKIVAENMSYVMALEAQCDAQVDAVTSELTKLLKDNGKDTALVDAIKTAYNNEKELKKAYYISLYK